MAWRYICRAVRTAAPGQGSSGSSTLATAAGAALLRGRGGGETSRPLNGMMTLTARECSSSSRAAIGPMPYGCFLTPMRLSRRAIRTVIPPRPAVTVLVYVDRMGRAVRDGSETDLSLIRTRDNKFYLQRVLPDGEVIRWLAPGLDYIKNVTNFDTYTLNEMNENGGIVIPADVMPTTPNDPPMYQDAVHYITQVRATTKFTRKDRRLWHRRLFAHWKESPDKYLNHIIGTYGVVGLCVLWIVVRGFHSIRNNKPFFDMDVYSAPGTQRTDPWRRLKRFSDMHPEHEGMDMSPVMMSPGQTFMSGSRAELRESDFTDPNYHSELWWKIRHCRYYGHWPKGIAE